MVSPERSWLRGEGLGGEEVEEGHPKPHPTRNSMMTTAILLRFRASLPAAAAVHTAEPDRPRLRFRAGPTRFLLHHPTQTLFHDRSAINILFDSLGGGFSDRHATLLHVRRYCYADGRRLLCAATVYIHQVGGRDETSGSWGEKREDRADSTDALCSEWVS